MKEIDMIQIDNNFWMCPFSMESMRFSGGKLVVRTKSGMEHIAQPFPGESPDEAFDRISGQLKGDK
jgi:hypothetical protein